MTQQWPSNWDDLTNGVGCGMCTAGRPEQDEWGIRVHKGIHTDAYLQRADVQRGYTVVIWRGRHVTEPVELDDGEAGAYWLDVLHVARGLIRYYEPLKMNYETLGNSLPHLHTHLIPRYREDPAPGQPFPLVARHAGGHKAPPDRIEREAAALTALLRTR